MTGESRFLRGKVHLLEEVAERGLEPVEGAAVAAGAEGFDRGDGAQEHVGKDRVLDFRRSRTWYRQVVVCTSPYHERRVALMLGEIGLSDYRVARMPGSEVRV